MSTQSETTTGSWTVPAGMQLTKIQIWADGADGANGVAKSAQDGSGGGGQGGWGAVDGLSIPAGTVINHTFTPGTSVVVTVTGGSTYTANSGVGATGGGASVGIGGDGGTCSFGTTGQRGSDGAASIGGNPGSGGNGGGGGTNDGTPNGTPGGGASFAVPSDIETAATDGGFPGGGGGGGDGSGGTGGQGGGGQVIYTYGTVPSGPSIAVCNSIDGEMAGGFSDMGM